MRTIRILKQLAGLSTFGATLALATPPALAQTFTPGDVYLVSAALPGPSGQIQAGIARIQPSSWTVTRLVDGPVGSAGRATFDAARQRIVVGGVGAPASLIFVDAAGVTTNFNVPRTDFPSTAEVCYNPAATGDGRIYFVRPSSASLAMLDALGVIHEVLNQAGTAPEPVAAASLHAAYFDPASQSLVLAIGQGATISYERLTFTPNGTRVASRAAVATPVLPSGEVVVGLSRGPAGSVFVKSDDNSNGTNRRMQLLSLDPLGLSTFASSGYFGVGGEVAGIYLPDSAAALVLDSLSDQLRLFLSVSPPTGTIVAISGVSSAGGSGERAQFVLVTPGAPACDPDLNQDGNIDQSDIDFLIDVVAGGPNPSGIDPDFNHDGNVDQADVDALVNVVAGGSCP